MPFTSGTVVRTVGLREVQAKLLAAQPRILANNMALVTAMLELVKGAEVSGTPIGPGHFGYHGRDTVRVTVIAQGGHTVLGQLRGAVQLYWREYGTGIRYRGKGRSKLKQGTGIMTGSITGGEQAFMVANKALNAARRLIRVAYGGMAVWWKTGLK